MLYIEAFLLTFFVSGIFAMGGVGSSIALIPLLNFIGVGFDISKTIGLFVNTATTSTASYLNIKKGLVNIKFIIPFLVMSVMFAPSGTYIAKILPVYYIRLFFVIFLFYSVYSMLFKKGVKSTGKLSHLWIMYPAGAIVGFMSGLLGIGGGALIIPMLAYMGLDPKKIAINVSFMIPFSTFIAFLSHTFVVQIDLILLAVTAAAGVLGGILGNSIMHKLKTSQMKKLLGVMLGIIAIKMFLSL